MTGTITSTLRCGLQLEALPTIQPNAECKERKGQVTDPVSRTGQVLQDGASRLFHRRRVLRNQSGLPILLIQTSPILRRI